MSPDPIARPRLRCKLLATRLALLWERLMAALWLPMSVGALCLALAWSGLLPLLPGWLHALVLGLSALALFAAVLHGGRGFRWPTAAEARNRLEAGSPHRPLTILEDRPARTDDAAADPIAAALWRAHTRHMAEDARRLTAQGPAPVVPTRDPYGLRVAAALALVISGAAAWTDPGGRLLRAMTPALSGPAQPPTVDIWVTPPDYADLPPLYRTSADPTGPDADATAPARPIIVPEGSVLLVLMQGGTAPEVHIGSETMTPPPLADGSHRLETALPPSGPNARLIIEDGARDVAAWPLTVIDDTPPRVAFSAPPSETGRWRLQVPFSAADDFGLASATFHFSRDGAPPQALELPLPGTTPSERRLVSAAPLLEIADHHWAGLPVEAYLSVTDAKGQEARTAPRRILLPERDFQHPVAQRIATLRRDLLIQKHDPLSVASALETLAFAPKAYDNDIVVFLGLSLASRRLIFGSRDDQNEVAALLWSLALRVEDGDLAEADKALAEAERALEQALEDNAPAADIQEKIEALRQAMQRYMQAMAQRMPGMESMPPMPSEALSSQDLDAMLQHMADLSELGARDAAQAMLDRLRQMLSNLRNARPMPNQALQQMRDMMDRLGELGRLQEELLNRTFQEHREAFQSRKITPSRQRDFLPPLLEGLSPPVSPPPSAGPKDQGALSTDNALTNGARLAEEQEALRQRLGNLLHEFARDHQGRIPEALGQAEHHMRDASEALAGQAWAPATAAQGEALKNLRSGQEEALQQMMQAMGMGMALIPGGTPSMGSDPMGRMPGGIEAHGVKIPTDAAASRVRDIMLELRRRSNDRQRPDAERDYIRRLLERF